MNLGYSYNPYRYTGRKPLYRGDKLWVIIIIALICVALNIFRIYVYRDCYERVSTRDWEVYNTEVKGIYNVKVQYIYEGGMYWEVIRGVNEPLLNMSIDRRNSDRYNTYLDVYVNKENHFDCRMMTYSAIYEIIGQSTLLMLGIIGIPIFVNKRGW